MKVNLKKAAQIFFILVFIAGALVAVFYNDIFTNAGNDYQNAIAETQSYYSETEPQSSQWTTSPSAGEQVIIPSDTAAPDKVAVTEPSSASDKPASTEPSVESDKSASTEPSAISNKPASTSPSTASDKPAAIAPPATTDKPAATAPTKIKENPLTKILHETAFYKVLNSGKVQCGMCFRHCTIDKGKRGFCSSRENIDGKLYTLTYGKPVAINIDPVEKIPFSNFHPGTDALCIGTPACNLRCLNCINWQFAQKAPEDVETVNVLPSEIIRMAKDNKLDTVCFTYNEPTICYEYMMDVFKLAKQAGLKTVFHSNASMSIQALDAILPYTDAIVADLKGFDEEFYRNNCSSELTPVLAFLKEVKSHRTWLEVVNLVIPGRNDSQDMITDMSKWLKENLGVETPVQFSRFFPTNKLTNLPPTPVTTLENACRIAKGEGLEFVYIGNVPGNDLDNTYCPYCGQLLIERRGLAINTFNIENGKCKFCKKKIAGIW